ncbi:hypothetical protein [Chlamydia sp. 04-14]|uniref:hypothetical protein n=1 Tax=Chlamydia TaxID=810 RepID=UPI002FC671FF
MTSVPTSPTTIPTSNFSSVEKTDLNELISNTEKKIKRCNILAIVVIVAAALLSAIGIICAIVTGVGGLWALPVGAILSAIVLLMALHQHCSYLESKLPAPKILDAEEVKKGLDLDEKPKVEDDPKTPVDRSGKAHPTDGSEKVIDPKKASDSDGDNKTKEVDSSNQNKEVEDSEHPSETEESDEEFSDVDSTNDIDHTGGTNDSENTGGSSSTETHG